MSETQLPQFLFTYYNPFDEKRPDFSDSLTSYVKDVQLANYTGKVVGKFLEQQTEQQLAAIADMNRDVSYGLENISYGLKNISYGLKNIDNTLDDGFSQINQRLTLIQAEQFNTNLLLKDIKEILRQPDSEKQRMNHIKLGMKFFNQALKNEEIINDAIEEFEHALALMKQDWLTSYQLGLCHTYHPSVQNFDKAEKLFLNAAKYSAVDWLNGDDFAKYFYKAISIASTNDNVLLDFSAECYLQIAFIRYVQSDFKGAVEFATKATQVSDKNPKAFFLLAKYQTRYGKEAHAINSLRKADLLNDDIYKVFALDIDIIKNEHFNFFYSNLSTSKEVARKEKKAAREEYAKTIGVLIITRIVEIRCLDSLKEYFLNTRFTFYVYFKIKEAFNMQFEELKCISQNGYDNKFDDIRLIAAKKIVDRLNKKDKLVPFIEQSEIKSNKYVSDYERPFLIDDMNGKFWDVRIMKDLLKKIDSVDVLHVYKWELKQAGVFDNIKICGNNDTAIEACKMRLDDFINSNPPRDVDYLIEAFNERAQQEKQAQEKQDKEAAQRKYFNNYVLPWIIYGVLFVIALLIIATL